MVPFLSLADSYVELQPRIDAAISRVLASGTYIGGVEVDLFEREFAAYCGSEHCVGVSNGLDALTLCLRALGIGAGDEVIVPAHTFIATWLSVSACGAVPVPVEPDYTTFNIDPALIEAAITPKTKAVIAVHLYGQPADLNRIRTVTARHHLYLIEDAAQAHGASYQGRRIGAHGHLVAWSFYPGKNLGAFGDAGAVTTNDENLAGALRRLRNYGSVEKYYHEIQGANARLDPIQAAVLRVKLGVLDVWNQRRRRIAEKYLEGLRGCGIGLPSSPENTISAWHLFVVTTSMRDKLFLYLQAQGISTLIHYPVPPHRQAAYRNCFPIALDPLPKVTKLGKSLLSLPLGPHLSDDDVHRVIEAVRNFMLLNGNVEAN